VFRTRRTHSDPLTNTMTESKGSNMTPDDALEDTLDFQETVESLIASRPDLADPGRLRRFETALHRQLAKLGPTPEAARARERDAWAAAERERARKMMAFSMTVSGGVLAAMLTFIIAPSAPLPVFAGMGILGLLASKYGGPKLDRWWERRRRGHGRFPV
jgi:hypothetical protein